MVLALGKTLCASFLNISANFHNGKWVDIPISGDLTLQHLPQYIISNCSIVPVNSISITSNQEPTEILLVGYFLSLSVSFPFSNNIFLEIVLQKCKNKTAQNIRPYWEWHAIALARLGARLRFPRSANYRTP